MLWPASCNALQRVRMLLALELEHLAQAPAMAVRAERGIDERPHVFLGGLRADRARTEGHHIAAVVLDHLMGGVDVVGDARAHAGSLLAATVTPAPLPQIRTARSARPAAIASPTSLAKIG